MEKSHQSFISLLPLVLFVSFFLGATILFAQPVSALFPCILALLFALFFTFSKDIPFNKRIELFIQGSSQHTAIATCYILVLSAIFTYVLDLIGGTDAAVVLGMALLPTRCILPGFFTLVSLFATTIGSSMGAIAAFLPIGLGIANTLGIDPALMCGIVVGGAMLGDNLSVISDTTIAATQTTHCKMHDKFKANSILVLPAFLLTSALLLYLNQGINVDLLTLSSAQEISFSTVVPVLPYLFIFILAPCNIDVIALLLGGIAIAIALGVAQGNFTFLESTGFFLKGFACNTSVQEVFLLILLVAGLSYIVEYNGGINYLFEKVSHKIHTKAGAEITIAILVFLVNMAVAINTIAILVTGPVAKSIADKVGISKERVASLIDVVACICQGILPYAPQLLLAASLARISSISILPFLHYQWFIALVTVCSIVKTYCDEKRYIQ